jgi:predicted porin
MDLRLPHLMIARLLVGGAVLLAAATGVPPVWAQDAKEKEIQELRQRLDRLENEIGVKKEAPAVAPAPGAPAAPPQSVGDRIKTLEETIKSTPLFGVIKDWNFGGHAAVSYNYNFNDPRSRNNVFRVFDDKANQFDINQAELWIEKPISTESPIGFGLDFVIGRDAKKIHSLGLGINSGDDPTKSDVFDLTQAYVTYKAPIGKGLDLKAGKFVTLHGAEVIRRTGNFNISRSLAFGFAIPFTHTGIMATYPFTDWLTVTAGIVNGWDNTDDNNNDKSFHGMATITPMKDLTVIIGGTWGPEARFAGDDANGPKRGLLDLVATYKPIPPLTLTVNYDYGTQDEAFGAGTPTATWHAIAGYAQYDLTDKLSVGIRGEYFRDEEGFRLAFTDPITGNPARLNVWEITLTGRYKLLDHLFASIEYRHDQATNDRKVFDDNGLDSSGFQKKSDSQDTIALELVYQF